MLRLPKGTRIFMAVKPVDMRRSFDGLCATIMEGLGSNPLSGDLFLFRGKRADRIKAIIWDRNGLAIWYKRLERGKYKWPSHEAVSIELSEHELTLLLDGVDFTRIRRLPPFALHTPSP
jgi:transposase